jgi:dihydroorotate dehydrogenase
MIKFLYKNFLKPILFLFPADDVHVLFLWTGNFLGRFKLTRWLFKKILAHKNILLSQEIFGIKFENPIGLAAGFDYDADLINILPSVGFGYHTIGTVTNLPYGGNDRPMLGRLPKSKSLLVNKGFKSMGLFSVLKKINKSNKRIPLGISIGSTNRMYGRIEEMVEDVFLSFEKVLMENYFDYFELNISCPNLINTENLTNKFDTPEGLKLLLGRLNELSFNRPLFIKMYLEKNEEDTLLLAETASSFSFVSGLIFSNLVKNRSNSYFNKGEIEKKLPII